MAQKQKGVADAMIKAVISAGTTGMRTDCRTPEGIRQDVAPHTPYVVIVSRAGNPENGLTSSTRTT